MERCRLYRLGACLCSFGNIKRMLTGGVGLKAFRGGGGVVVIYCKWVGIGVADIKGGEG